MRRGYTYLIFLGSLLNVLSILAQVDPGSENLKHQWTFDSGLPIDDFGGVDGALVGGATISGKKLNTSGGGYLSFSGNDIGINTYQALTTEIWFKSASGQNSGNTMLAYFGDADVDGWKGANYIFTSPSNGGNCRMAISTGTTTEPWSNEDGINRTEGAIDDGILHHLVSIVSSSSITLYLDGEEVGTTALSGTNNLASVGITTAFLCKSGYSSDPTWKGEVNKYSIYNKALTADEVLFLFQQGAESSTAIETSKSSFAFDEVNMSGSFSVTGINLTEDISITAPAGITLSADKLAANASAELVNITYDGATVIDDNITLTSGAVELYLPVKASANDACFTPLYNNVPNLITDPYMNTINDSWGNVSVVSGSDVYCGSSCLKIAGTASCWPDGGSVNSEEIIWLPNTTYRFRAKVKTVDGSFNMGVQNANIAGGSGDFNMSVPNTQGVWDDFDATFTTGSAPTSGVAFFNNCGSATGVIAYLDNWELYAVPGISTSTTQIFVDDLNTETSFKVSGVGLVDDISIIVPAGISVDKDILDATVSNETITVSYNGSTNIEEDIVLNSGDYTQIITVTSYNNEACFDPLYPDATNLIKDVYLNDLNNFAGWGSRAINNDPKYAYCGVRSGMVSESGSIVNDLTGVLKPNTTYRVKAKVYRENPGNVTYNLDVDQGAHPTEYQLIKTAMDSACYYYNRYTPFKANIYVYYNAGVPTAQASYYGSMGFGSNHRYMWVGTAIHEMDHYFGSGTSNNWWNLMVDGKWQGSSANALVKELTDGETTAISGDSQHFWPYGINQKEEVTNLGGQAAQEKALIDAVRIAKAMLVDDAKLVSDFNTVGIGVYGWDGNSEDIYHEVITLEKWQDVDFTFTTGQSLGNQQAVYFNSGSGYIDNWEMYEVPATAVDEQDNQTDKLYIEGENIVAEFYLNNPCKVRILIYDIQGTLILEELFSGDAGFNRYVKNINLPAGVYFAKRETNNQVYSVKLVK